MQIPNDFNNRINGNTSVNHNFSGSVEVNKNYSTDKDYGKSLYTYKPINLQGIDTIAFIGELKSLDNMHCPLCGTKMLSEKEFRQAMKEANEIKSPEDFCNFLDKYSSCIVPELKSIVKDSKLMFYKLRKPEIEPFLNILKEGYTQKTAQSAEKTNEIFYDTLNKYPLCDNDKKLLSDCQVEINHLYKNKSKDALLKYLNVSFRNTIKLLQAKNKNDIYNELSSQLKKDCRLELLFTKSLAGMAASDSRQKSVLRNLLQYSKSDIHKVNNNRNAQKGTILNMILTCEHCSTEQKNLYKLQTTNEIHNYYKHLQELALAALNGKLNSNKAYPIVLANFVRDTSNERINPDDNDVLLKQLSNITGVTKNRDVNFELVQHSGIPCYTCGQETITHEDKCALFEKIKNTSSMYEIAKIFDDKKNIIKPIYLPLIEEFKGLLIKLPTATEADILSFLRQNKYEQIKEELYNCASIAATTANINNYNEYNQNLINTYIEKTQNMFLDMDKDKKFDFHYYQRMMKETIGELQDQNNSKYLLTQKLIRKIKELYAIQVILFPEEAVCEKVGNAIKVISQDVFKNSVATVKDLDVKIPNSDFNTLSQQKGRKIIMCSGCKKAQKDKNLKFWYKLHPEIKQNLPKYLHKIEELSQNKEISGFEYYPYEILENIRKLTDGELDIPLNSL